MDQVDQGFLDEWIGTWEWSLNTRVKLLGMLSRFLENGANPEMDRSRLLTIMKPKRQTGGTTEPFDLEHEDGKILAAAWRSGKCGSG